MSGRRKSTNPFDSDSDDDDDDDDDLALFHDAREIASPRHASRKTAGQAFWGDSGSLNDHHDYGHAEFLSPLESALLELNNAAGISPTGVDSDELVNGMPDWALASRTPAARARGSSFDPKTSLQSISPMADAKSIAAAHHHQQQQYRPDAKKQRKRRSSGPNQPPCPVLQKIEEQDSEFVMDHDGGTSTPWTKLLLLEELGTASSWSILLIPYIALFLSLLLDTYSSVLTTSVRPLNSTSICPAANNITTSGLDAAWLRVSAGAPCSYPYSIEQQQTQKGGGEIHNRQFESLRYRVTMDDGVAFVSGPVLDVPPMSVFLRGDAKFDELSTEATAMVAQGRVVYSTVVLQRSSRNDWVPISISTPERLILACTSDTAKATMTSKWQCASPRIIDVLFSLPGTGVLSGEELQIVVLYSTTHTPSLRRDLRFSKVAYDDAFQVEEASYVFSETPGAASLLFYTGYNHTEKRLEELVSSSSYVLEQKSNLYVRINAVVRLSTLLVTTIFLVLWCRAVGTRGILGCGSKSWSCRGRFERRTNEERIPLKKKLPVTNFWWESPWVVFPERRYLLALLLCLILVQNPLLAAAYFMPAVYKSPQMRAAADCILGVGVFGVLMTVHCIFHGLRYHTAEVTRRRAKQQRQVLELRRTAVYMANVDGATSTETEDAISRYLTEYYETYGDVDGSGFSTLDNRLRHDPCGHDWPDFLLPKLILFFVSIASVIMASLYRFPITYNSQLSQPGLRHYNAIYICSSFVELFMALMWSLMIVRQASRTGWMLRKEPFLSTRPAQLAYRIFIAMLILGLVALVLPFLLDMFLLLKKWTFNESNEELDDLAEDQDMLQRSSIDVILQLLLRITERFPYSGTAASVGPGKIVYVTVCGLVAAFIFLPSSEVSKRRSGHGITAPFTTLATSRKRDKRLVVLLARYTQSWRVFPAPIKRMSIAGSLLSDISFNIGPSNRSLVFFGRYTPVFCLEVACWLLEASWQAYYSPPEFEFDDVAPPRMCLESIGLKLEKCILDKSTDSQAFIATNIHSQVDGEEDSIIVISFRGTASATSMAIDLKFRQVPLLDQIIGLDDFPMFQVSDKGVTTNDSGDWFWDTPFTRKAVLKSFTPALNEGCLAFTCRNGLSTRASTSFNFGAKAVLAATPVTRQTLPCVHEGFLEAYSHLRKQVLECVVGVMQRQLAKAIERSTEEGTSLVLPKVYVTGHSLGGAVGQLFALDLATNCVVEVPTEYTHNDDDITTMEEETFHPSSYEELPPSTEPRDVFLSPFDDTKWFHAEETSPSPEQTVRLQPPIAVYTYGQTRVGNHAFSRLYKQRVPHTFRVVNEGDALTTLPNSAMLGGQYKHAGLEVMLDEGCTGNIIVGPTVVETMFRFSKMRTSVTAHSLDRYRRSLESGLTEAELNEYYRGHGISKASTHKPTDSLPAWLTQARVESYV